VPLTTVRHVGITVSDIDRALAFWEDFLGAPPRARTVLERPYVEQLVGLPAVRIKAAFFALPGTALEILEYAWEQRRQLPQDSFNPGHAHICFMVEDIAATLARAAQSGAYPVCREGPVAIDEGPNAGNLAVYLRVPPDWHTIELFQAL
jgi:glyoxylase I family protein